MLKGGLAMRLLIKFRNTVMYMLKMLTVVTYVTAFIAVWQSFYHQASFSGRGNYLVVFTYVAVLLVFVSIYDAFKVGIMRVHELIYSMSLSLAFTNFFVYFELCLVARGMLNPLPILLLMVAQILIVAVFTQSLNHSYFALYKARSVLAIFSVENKSDIIKKMAAIKERFALSKGITADKGLDAIKKEIKKYETVLICDFDATLKAEVLKYCYSKNKRIYLLPSSADTILNGSYPVQIFDTPVLFLHNGGLSMEQRIIKRTMDIILSLFGIVITSPIMLVIALAIKLTDGGPIIFKQVRVTRNQKLFNIYKFRSMKVQSEDEVKLTTIDDDRVTKVGKLIRPLRLDELPQLFNILFGHMSVVGPRPEMKEVVESNVDAVPEFNLRHKVKAGLTGYAQIYGKYNTTPQNKLNMDLFYIEHYSVLEDIKLIIMTVKILFVRESTEGFSEKDSKVKNCDN